MKEESNTSHVNQGYNQQMAKTNKKNAVQSLHNQQKIMKYKMGKTQPDQYELVQCGMCLVRQVEPATWVVPFCQVNLEPST
jgi:hypothetical protein